MENITLEIDNPAIDIQANFLYSLMQEQKKTYIFLANGIKLIGKVIGFDEFSITLSYDGSSQLIYKHAISTILPASEN